MSPKLKIWWELGSRAWKRHRNRMSQGLQREWLEYNVYVINIIEYMIERDFFRISGERISASIWWDGWFGSRCCFLDSQAPITQREEVSSSSGGLSWATCCRGSNSLAFSFLNLENSEDLPFSLYFSHVDTFPFLEWPLLPHSGGQSLRWPP